MVGVAPPGGAGYHGGASFFEIPIPQPLNPKLGIEVDVDAGHHGRGGGGSAA